MVQIVKGNGDPFVEIAAVLPPPKNWTAFPTETEPGYVPEWILTMLNNQLPPPNPARDGMAAYSQASGTAYDATIF
jgi:hypothetical protein